MGQAVQYLIDQMSTLDLHVGKVNNLRTKSDLHVHLTNVDSNDSSPIISLPFAEITSGRPRIVTDS